jgi:hypothetical protein
VKSDYLLSKEEKKNWKQLLCFEKAQKIPLFLPEFLSESGKTGCRMSVCEARRLLTLTFSI